MLDTNTPENKDEEIPKDDLVENPEEEEQVEPTEPEAEEEEESKPEEDESSEQESAEESAESDDEAESEDDGITVTIEGEDPAEDEEESSAPRWVKDLRKDYRKIQREKKKLEEQLKQLTEKKDQTVELGKKPELDDEGIDHDPEKLVEARLEWEKRKRKLEQQAEAKKQENRQLEEAFQQRIAAYNEKKKTTKVKNFEELEEVVNDGLSLDIRSAILMEAEDPHMLVAALGNSPKNLEKFKNVKNGVQLGKLIAQTESKMNIHTRKPPPPEKTLKGNASVSGSVNSTLDRLEAEAQRTGDRSKLIEYKRKLNK